jgi:hypothetical protein
MAAADYYIAQYLREPFRREPRNVGVIVVKDSMAAARFLGETDAGVIEAKRIRSMPHPDIYRHWVDSWREEISDDTSVPLAQRLLEQNGGNYNVVAGGQVTDTGEDSADAIAQFLYSSLVKKESVFLADEQEEAPVKQFKQQITSEFRRRSILSGSEAEGVKHPIYADQSIMGKATSHTPAYNQLNGTLWIMEPVNFAMLDKRQARDHAGWTAKVFDDIVERNKNRKVKAEGIALIYGGRDDLGEDIVKKTLPLLETSARLVFWDRTRSRNKFLKEREEIAKAG